MKKKYRFKKRNSEIDKKNQIEKRYKVLIVLILILLSILIGYLFYVQIMRRSYFKEKVEVATIKVVEGDSAPRGRIYDRNGKLVVDNIAVRTIVYKKNGLSTKDEINLAYKVGSMIDVNFSRLTDDDKRLFWLKNNYDEASKFITESEYNDLKERKIDSDTIEKYKLERIPKEYLNRYSDNDLEAAYIFKLMNTGYNYAEKVIKKDNVSAEEYAIIAENLNDLPGLNVKLDWDREYLYGNVFKTILGSVSTSESGIPYELKSYYLNKGYELNDRVGTSYLEYQYEDVLKGIKNKYQVIDGKYVLLFSDGGYATKSWKEMITSGVSLDKENAEEIADVDS